MKFSKVDACFVALLLALVAFGLVADAVSLDIETYEKSLAFLAILLVGRLLQLKAQAVQHAIGFQQVILSCFLPALLYRSLLTLNTDEMTTAWVYVVVSLAFSAFLDLGFSVVLAATGFSREQGEKNTLSMMFSGLAPGLTSLPYIDGVVSQIAPFTVNAGHCGLADLGIKVWVLFIKYLIAFRVAGKTQQRNAAALKVLSQNDEPKHSGPSLRQTLQNLVVCFFTEPVNCGSILGVVLLAAGPVRLENQSIWGEAVKYMAASCSPAIFLLIGIKMKLQIAEHLSLLMLMMFRSGLAFLFTAILSQTIFKEDNDIMFWAFFCNAAVSFWPYTHMVKISSLEAGFQQRVCASVFAEVASDEAMVFVLRGWFESQGDLLRLGKVQPGTALTAAEGMIAGEIAACLDEDGEGMAAIRKAQGELDKLFLLETTFDLPVALMMLGVSFTWTIALCTVLSLTPTDFWTSPVVLPIIGGALVLISGAYLFCHGRRLAMQAKADAVLADAVVDPAAKGSGSLGSVHKAGRRNSTCFVGSVQVDTFVAMEACIEVQRKAEREQIFGAQNGHDSMNMVEFAQRMILPCVDTTKMSACDRRSLSMGIPDEVEVQGNEGMWGPRVDLTPSQIPDVHDAVIDNGGNQAMPPSGSCMPTLMANVQEEQEGEIENVKRCYI